MNNGPISGVPSSKARSQNQWTRPETRSPTMYPAAAAPPAIAAAPAPSTPRESRISSMVSRTLQSPHPVAPTPRCRSGRGGGAPAEAVVSFRRCMGVQPKMAPRHLACQDGPMQQASPLEALHSELAAAGVFAPVTRYYVALGFGLGVVHVVAYTVLLAMPGLGIRSISVLLTVFTSVQLALLAHDARHGAIARSRR